MEKISIVMCCHESVDGGRLSRAESVQSRIAARLPSELKLPRSVGVCCSACW